jgi:hypothetical protein
MLPAPQAERPSHVDVSGWVVVAGPDAHVFPGTFGTRRSKAAESCAAVAVLNGYAIETVKVAPAQLHVDVTAAEVMSRDAAELAKVNAAVKRAASRRGHRRRQKLEQL